MLPSLGRPAVWTPGAEMPESDESFGGGGVMEGSIDTVPIVYVNGTRHELPPDSANTTLLQYIRGEWGQNHGAKAVLCVA